MPTAAQGRAISRSTRRQFSPRTSRPTLSTVGSSSPQTERVASGRPSRRATRTLLASLPPVFHSEDPSLYGAAFARNQGFAQPGPFQTQLPPHQEKAFRSWAAEVKQATGVHVPIHGKTDYDYRGHFQAAGSGIPHGHYPDKFKTPYDTSFSALSQYATPDNPLTWRGKNLVNRRSGRVIFGGS